jgi:hypothetical protein
MKTVRIAGGPAPQDVRIELDGKDITDTVLALEITSDAQSLARARLTFFAEVDVRAELEEGTEVHGS